MTQGAEPETVGRYRLVSRLARGGMAEVFLGVLPGPEGFEKPVVLKRMLPELAGQEEYRQMFAQEARLMATFGHAHVVSVLDFGLEASAPYLVLEYVEGVDLARALATRGPLAPALVRHLGLCLLRALEHVHALRDTRGEWLGLVHRDVSPANVLLGRTGDPADTLLQRVGPGLAVILQRALRPHPAERFVSAADMARALLSVNVGSEAEQPWRVAELVAETLAAEHRPGPSAADKRVHGPFSAALLASQGDEEA
jgi:serine/threonine protein kinase